MALLKTKNVNISCLKQAVIVILTGYLHCVDSEITEYCGHFSPRCGNGEVIVITHAVYGRMRVGKCVAKDLGYIGCQVDIMHVLDTLCSNKKECTIDTHHDLASHSQIRRPCMDGLLQYLEADYKCEKALHVDGERCRSGSSVYEISSKTSISSDHLVKEHCGGSTVKFTSRHGQKLNISIIDFSQESSLNSQSCFNYLELADDSAGTKVPVCAGARRQRHILLSSGNEITATFHLQDPEKQRFLLQFDAVGCGDISPPEGTWVQRDGDETTLGCHSGKHTWTLTCQHNQWVGAVGSCGTGLVVAKPVSEPEQSDYNIAPGMVAFAVCSVFLLICSCAFTIGVCIYTSSRSNPSQKNYPHSNMNPTQTLRLVPPMRQQTTNQRIPTQNQCGSEKSKRQYPTQTLMQNDTASIQKRPFMPLDKNFETEQDYINTTNSQTDSVYSDSVKYYVLENLNDARVQTNG